MGTQGRKTDPGTRARALKLISEGRSQSNVAGILRISKQTVKRIVANSR